MTSLSLASVRPSAASSSPVALGDQAAVHAAQQAGIGDQLLAGEPVEQPQAVGQDADLGLGGHRVGPDVDAQHVRGAGVGTQQPGGHRQGRGLAGTVGSHEAVERPARDVEVEVVDGGGLAEALGQAAQAEGDLGRAGGHGRAPVAARARARAPAWSRR